MLLTKSLLCSNLGSLGINLSKSVPAIQIPQIPDCLKVNNRFIRKYNSQRRKGYDDGIDASHFSLKGGKGGRRGQKMIESAFSVSEKRQFRLITRSSNEKQGGATSVETCFILPRTLGISPRPLRNSDRAEENQAEPI